MDIFENLENLNVSEECFNDIMDIVEEIISERTVNDIKRAAKNSLDVRQNVADEDPWANSGARLKKAERILKELPNSKRDIKDLTKAAKNVLKSRGEKAEASFGIRTPERKRLGHARLIASLGKGGGVKELIKNDSRPDAKTRKLDAAANERARKLRVKYNNLSYNDGDN
jgi:uncharacterized protein (UPF0147 family)